LRVTHLTTSDGGGGAGYFVTRLHRSLLEFGANSRVLVGRKQCNEPGFSTWYTIDPTYRQRIGWGRAIGLNDLFLPYGKRLRAHPDIGGADVLHIHNLHGGYLSPLWVRGLTESKPSVLTLHDEWALTGHCAYTRGCNRWEHGCGRCPHPEAYPAIQRDATRVEWQIKKWALGKPGLRVTCPSTYLKDMASHSHLGRHRLQVIPHGVDLTDFSPTDKSVARTYCGIPADAKVILVAAHNLAAPIKGISPFVTALSTACAERREDNVVLLSFGANAEQLPVNPPLRQVSLGTLSDDRARQLAFCSADIMVSPSRGEAFGLAVAESIACGTPVVAFGDSGSTEIVHNNISGALCRSIDSSSLAQMAIELLNAGPRRLALAQSARQYAERHLSWNAMVDAYVRTYQQIVPTAS